FRSGFARWLVRGLVRLGRGLFASGCLGGRRRRSCLRCRLCLRFWSWLRGGSSGVLRLLRLRFCCWLSRRCFGELELARVWHAGRQRLLDGVADHDPAALDAGHGAFDQDQSTRNISLPDAKIECSHPFDAEMSGHLFVLESLAWILATAG